MANQYYDGGNAQGFRSGRSGYDANDAGKIFVGGLHRDTGDDELRTYFSKFGGVTETMVKKDPYSGASRGFGFVKFKDSSSVDRVLAESTHTLQGKVIDPKRAQNRGTSEVCRKIFIGGLDPNLPEESIREYFGRFGKIDLVEQPVDREKNIKKGFCFITFESGDPVEVICATAKHPLGGRDVDVKKATPKEKMAAQAQGGRGRGAPGGPGRGRGRGDGFSGGWDGQQPNYGMAPGYPGGYDYSAYYGQQPQAAPVYGAYGQAPPQPYPMPDPYAQAYAAAGAAAAVPSSGYDYSAWYGAPAPTGGPGQQNGGGGAMYGRGQRPTDNRYQPY